MTTSVDNIAVLAKLDIFRELPNSIIAQLNNDCRWFDVDRGTILIDGVNPHAHGVFVIANGQAAVEIPGCAHDDNSIANLSAVASFGEFGVINGKPGSASVRCLSQCLIGEIPREVFLNLVVDQPQLSLALLRKLIERLRGVGSDHPFLRDTVAQVHAVRSQLAAWSL